MSTEPVDPAKRTYPEDTPASIRRQAVWAFIAAVALLYYGYKVVADDGSTEARVFLSTLRYGGIAMVVAAAALATGTKWGLLVDGVVSLMVGAGLAFTGIVLVKNFGVGTQPILLLVFAYLFLSGGWRSFRGFLGADSGSESQAVPPPSAPPAD